MTKKAGEGIAVCGSVLVDRINEIEVYPAISELTKITDVSRAVGGCVPNVAIDLKKICPSLSVNAIGKTGTDSDGKYIRQVLVENGVGVEQLKGVSDERTSFTEVMSVKGGQRTFFTYAGADSGLTAADIDFSKNKPKILHLGYFLLLQKIDDGEGIEILKKASENGIETSIDLVSESSDRYSLVLPCLAYTDYLIINEIEAAGLTGIDACEENLVKMAIRLKELGVRKKVIIHMKSCAVCCSDDGVTAVGSVDIPKSEIKGTTGAGDAFCAGALYAIYCKRSDREILEFASCTAVMALRSSDATGGLCSEKKIMEYCENLGRIKICW